jgi:hypothetical protein
MTRKCTQCGEPGAMHDEALDAYFCDENCRQCFLSDHPKFDIESMPSRVDAMDAFND